MELDWNATKFSGRRLEIDLIFLFPEEISPEIIQDKLKVTYKNPSDFKSVDGEELGMDYTELFSALRK